MISGTKQSGATAKKILDFYHDIYLAKFKEKPIINGGRDMRALKEFFDYNDFSLDFLKVCVIMYLNIENDWLEDQGYPMWSFPDKVHQCRKELDYKYKYFKGTQEQYYKKYVENNTKLLNIEINDRGSKQNRREDKKPSTNNKD